MNDLTIINKEGILVVDSREVAEMIGKEHKNLLRDIKGYVDILTSSNLSPLVFFIESTYTDNKGEERPCYLLTKKGCDMVANKMTGEKGVIFTAKYVTKFEEMEQQLKNQEKQLDISQLSPQLQMFKQIFDTVAKAELEQKRLREEIKETKEQVTTIKDVIAINPKDDWRKKTNLILNKIGGQLGDYKRPKNEAYLELEKRAGCNLEKLLENAIKRAETSGAPKKVINELNYLDVIDNNKRLREIYIAIVKEMAIKYGVKMNKEAM